VSTVGIILEAGWEEKQKSFENVYEFSSRWGRGCAKGKGGGEERGGVTAGGGRIETSQRKF